MKGEFHLIERLRRLTPASLHGAIPRGDDAGAVRVGGRLVLFTTDAIVEGVDFLLGKRGARPEEIGHKALAVNLSDIAAMGAKPLAFVVAWGLPPQLSAGFIERMGKGMARLAKRFRVAWVGGDLSRARKLFISIAMLGEARPGEVVLRKGARPGHWIYVTGTLGGSIRGKHLNFLPRIDEAKFLTRRFRPTAMIDVSDGFIQDLGHLLTSSRVGARIHLERIPISGSARLQAREKGERSALKGALTDGEDFELLFTVSARRARGLERAWKREFPRVPLSRVGQVIRGKSEEIEWVKDKRPVKLWFRKRGFTHF